MSFYDQLAPVDTVLERSVGPYRLLGEPGHAEGGSLLFEGEGPGGEHASVQVAAAPVAQRRVRARFRRLAGLRAELSHPALLPVREVGEDNGRLFVVTDKRPSATLAGLLGTGPLDPRTVLELLTAAAAGLDAAHGRGLVHQTLGADSLLLPDGALQLDLFGLFMLVRQAGWGDVVRRAPHVAYESPEALRGEQPTPASNVYSLTGVLVHALTGQEPYPHSDPMLIHSSHFSDPPPSPSERVEALGTDLDDVVARGMAKHPSERPASAGELIEQARAALALGGSVAAPPLLPAEPEIEPEPEVVAEPEPEPEVVAEPEPELEVAPEPEPEVAAAPEPPPAADPASQGPAPMLEAWLLPEGETAVPPPAFAESSAPTQPLVAAAAAPTKPPLAQRVRPWLPLIAIVIVAAAFGALLASPGSDPAPAPQPSAPRADAQAVATLDIERVRLRDELALAETPDEQVAAAEGLAGAHRAAAGDVSDEALGGALDDVAAAYDDLAAAARSGDEAAYAAASEDVASADEALASALRTR